MRLFRPIGTADYAARAAIVEAAGVRCPRPASGSSPAEFVAALREAAGVPETGV